VGYRVTGQIRVILYASPIVALYLNRDRKEPGGIDRNSSFMVGWLFRPIRRRHALEHHSEGRQRRWKTLHNYAEHLTTHSSRAVGPSNAEASAYASRPRTCQKCRAASKVYCLFESCGFEGWSDSSGDPGAAGVPGDPGAAGVRDVCFCDLESCSSWAFSFSREAAA
jgi:hypothetical protein